MLTSSLIVKKREGQELSDDEIQSLIGGFCDGSVTDYQMAALAMAICLRGMNPRETATLTLAMLNSGQKLPRRSEKPSNSADQDRPRVDKHSTGGLGDKVSLILAPLLSVCGVDVPMVSGRGLGLTGGTLDKLEAIPGFRVDYSGEESIQLIERVGCCIISASEQIAPADRKLYALRDVTGTVESIPLITASILSKKLSASLDALVMDVKVGDGAFMKTKTDAIALAKSLVTVGRQAGLPTTALLSDMDQPLGTSIGNAIEVNESVDVLQGKLGSVRDLTIQLCAELLVQVKVHDRLDQAISSLAAALDDGSAMERFEQMVAAQQGRWSGKLPLDDTTEIRATSDGYVHRIHCRSLGEQIVLMGGGRRVKSDRINAAVGIQVLKRVGDRVTKGEPVAILHCPRARANDYAGTIANSIEVHEQAADAVPLVLDRIESAI